MNHIKAIDLQQIKKRIKKEKKPVKVVSLVPSISELLSHYEPHINLIGVTRFCELPSSLRQEKNIIGGTKNPHIEKIFELNPDLIIANKEENNKSDIIELQRKHPVWVSDINSIKNALKMIKDLESFFEIPKNKLLAEKITQTINNFNKEIRGTVAYIIWNNPIMTVGTDTYINDWIKKIGLKNIITQKRYPTITHEELSKLAPDFIFLSSEPYPFKQKNQQQFSLLHNKSNVVLVDGRMFSWYGKTMLQTSTYCAKLIKQLLV